MTVRAQVVGIGFDVDGHERVTLRMKPEDVAHLAKAGAFGRVVRVTFDPADPSARESADEDGHAAR